MNTEVTVYRSGSFIKTTETNAEKSLIEDTKFLDSHMPQGRDTRSEGIFCSPNNKGVIRWIEGSDFANQLIHGKFYAEDEVDATYSTEIHEAQVDPKNVWVYEVRLWDMFVDGSVSRRSDRAHDYWNSGMTLEKFLTTDLDPTEWEILLPAEKVVSSKSVDWKTFRATLTEPKDWEDRNTLLSVFDKLNSPFNHEEDPFEDAALQI